jgi:hypothetical protein
MSVQETYARTMKAEGVETEDMIAFENQQYSLSNDAIREVYETNFEIAERKGLTEEQRLDSFVVALMDKGVGQWESEEIAEMFDRTAGEFFNEDDDPDMPDEDEEGEEEEEEESEEKECEFFEV